MYKPKLVFLSETRQGNKYVNNLNWRLGLHHCIAQSGIGKGVAIALFYDESVEIKKIVVGRGISMCRSLWNPYHYKKKIARNVERCPDEHEHILFYLPSHGFKHIFVYTRLIPTCCNRWTSYSGPSPAGQRLMIQWRSTRWTGITVHSTPISNSTC